MGILYVIRHGQASFGQDDYDRLSDLGLRQAELTGRYLRAAGLAPDAVYTGGMLRQRQSAQAALVGLGAPPPRELPGLDEYDSGGILKALLPGLLRQDPSLAASLEGMYADRRAFQKVYEAVMRRWVAGGHDPGPCESWPAFQARAVQAWRLVLAGNQGGKTVLAFTSGGPIAVLLQQALSLADDLALNLTWVIKNASVSGFLHDGRRLTLSSFNSTAHLEQEGDPQLITYR